jgi:hypothetical protein
VAEIPFDETLGELAMSALDHGVDSVSGGGPLVPFALERRGDELSITRFAPERLEEGVDAARAHARASDADAVAIAFDSYLTVDGERRDAIVVEAQAGDAAYRFAQAYRPAGRFRKLERQGNPAFLGPADSLR